MKLFAKEADSVIRTVAILLGGLGLGAALMYVLDPDRGKRRRALARERAARAAHTASDRLEARSRDVRNRARGVAAEAEALIRHEEAPDPVLEERVRAEIGRAVSNPGSIEVTADGGFVILAGPVLASEIDGLLSAARGVRGVESVENRLVIYETPDAVSGRKERRPRAPAELGVDRSRPAEAET